jgi:glycosyltransferase involved in cell wall biosynthesis
MMLLSKELPRNKLAICIPVWNRGEIFKICFDSILQNISGLDVSIWIYDNSSDSKTKDIIHQLHTNKCELYKIFLPQNMGIPYVVNHFCKSIIENCDFISYKLPDYTLILDSDAYFKDQIEDLIWLLEKDFDIGIISGHDSIEHQSINERYARINGKKRLIKDKQNERMISMLLKREELLGCYPFPHHRNRDVDWELTQWNNNSMKKRSRKVTVVCDYVLHLGLAVSTWQSNKAIPNHSEEEIKEVKKILDKNNIKY